MKRLFILPLSFSLIFGSAHAMEMPGQQLGFNSALRDAARNQLLMDAAEEGELERCKQLVKDGADLFYTAPDKTTVLMAAANANEIEVCELLVEKMLNIPCAEQKNRIFAFAQCLKRICPNQFHNLCDVFRPHLRAMIKKENTPKVTRQILSVTDLEVIGTNLFKKYFLKEFQLIEALRTNDLGKAQAVIFAGVHPDDIMGPEGETVLINAATRGLKDIVYLFIKAGANVDHKDDSGQTALCYATQNIPKKGCRKICSMLIAAGADATIAGWKDIGE